MQTHKFRVAGVPMFN